MNKEQDDIIQEGSGPDKERLKLLHALQNELDADEAFEEDSAEGLAQFAPDKLNSTIEKLNAQLAKQTGRNKRKRKAIGNESYVYIAVITILLLILVAYLVIRKVQ